LVRQLFRSLALHRSHLIYCAPAELVPDLWPAIELHVERAIKHHPFMDADDVLLLLQQGTLQLFVATEDQKSCGICSHGSDTVPKP
jgi:hypothetical protein